MEDSNGKFEILDTKFWQIEWICPTHLGEELAQKAQCIAKGAFVALGCYDCARVEMRLNAEGNLYILEGLKSDVASVIQAY